MLLPEHYGDDLLSLAIDNAEERVAVAKHLRETGCWLECVEGMRCVVVQFDAAVIGRERACAMLEEQLAKSIPAPAELDRLIEIPVCYGSDFGPEFESICEMLDLSGEELIGLHTSREHRVDLIGFTPGFAYISGLNEDARVPRLTEPRQRVEPGSVGIAGGLTGLYALAGPGGWPLIGRTPTRLFRPDDEEPFRLRTGSRIRFKAIDPKTYRQMLP